MAASNVPTILRVIAASVKISNRAGQIIRDVMRQGELGIVEKGINDLQTEADRTAQRCITASLRRHFPKLRVFGEEDIEEGDLPESFLCLDSCNDVLKQKCPERLSKLTEEELIVWVDPLDGTAEYTQGLLDHVTVLIGVSSAKSGEALAGVVHQPYHNYKSVSPEQLTGRCIWGVVELGSFGIQRQQQLAGRVVTTSRSHLTATVIDAINALQPTHIEKVGGAGHKVLLLIEGRAHAYVFASPGCKKWDTCAPEAVLRALGGSLTDMLGKSIPYFADSPRGNSTGVLATVKDHSWYVERIPQAVKDDMLRY